MADYPRGCGFVDLEVHTEVVVVVGVVYWLGLPHRKARDRSGEDCVVEVVVDLQLLVEIRRL